MLCIVAGNALMAQSGSGFYVEPGGTMTVENNIIIYNSGQNINVTVSSFNAVTNATNILMDVENDFRLRAYSPAINFGNNQYVTWLRDFMDTLRIINEVVDLGAFEYPVWARAKQYAIHQVGTSGLTFCNNIIVNNPEHYAVTNVTSMPSHNILSDSVPVLKDAVTDFSLMSASPAVDAGQNSCNSSATDLQDGNRIFNNTIDIGAYEYVLPQTYTNTVYTVWQNSEGTLTFCNNIDINNCVWSLNTNITTLSSNIVTDNDSLFVDNVDDYRPRPESEAVDAGQDACNQVEKDLADKQRVMGEQIDIGAFEQYLENEDSLGVTYVVHQLSNHTLLLCNNVIVNNPEHHDVTNIVQVPSSNILSDSIPIFSDALLNFKPYYSSPAVDAGDNSCNGLPKDIDTVPRISGPAIDVGAFELPVRDDSSYTGGGSGGGAYYYAEFHHSTVHQNSGDSLVLCNNIIINNNWLIPNAYENADTICNILTDTDSLFMDNEIDYMPRPESQAVNTGCNDCNEVETDLSKKNRIYQDIIDIGAFEQYMSDDTGTHYNIVVHHVGVGTLMLCNNVIVNNMAMEFATNIEDIPTNNILSDSIQIFSDEVNNFALWSHSPAVDAGSNGCCLLPKDMKDNPRISNEVIDIGAFEYLQPILFTDTTFVVLQQDGMTLQLCNNIVINNAIFTPNTNIENVPNNNIIEDNDSVFTDNHWNYLPLPQSIAVNRGENSCNSVVFDLSKHPRIMADTIDVGAFEQYEAVEDTFLAAAVLGDTLHQLQLYNNIIINNPGHTDNVYGNVIGDHNLTQDVSGVFVDDSLNFKLLQQSPAIDAGDNQRVTWALDIKDDPRVACGNIVDQGAFEYVFDDLPSSLMANEVPTDNCQGYYFELIAPPGAQHYFWSHTNEDTNIVQVSPLLPTEYQVLVSNGGECVDSLSVFVIPQAIMADSMGSPASVGTTFWLSYLRNHFHEPTLTLQVSAEEACTGTVSNPQTGWSSSFSVAAHSVTVVNVPASVAYPTTSNQVGNFGLLVQTSDSVSLYAANYNTSSFDVTDVLPVDAISDEYVLQTYTPMMNAEFVVVATVDNTVVNITPSRALQGGHAAQQTFSVTLQAGQTYLGLSQYGGVLGDLSGTVIQAQDNKPIAVFNGNVCALVPSDNSYTDHLVEQAVGVKYWGRSFALTTTESQNFDVVRVTALRNNTEIRKNGVLMATLQAYQTHEFQLSGADGSCFIETSEPAGVYLYIAGAVQGNADERSDPSMIWIPPTEQKLSDLTFATFNSPGISDHYVNIVIPSASVEDVTFDGVNIGGQFTLLNGNSDYAFIRKYISNGTHTLHCEGGFIAHCYGLGYHESYGYAAGSKAVPLKEQLFVNGILNTDLPADMKFCPYEPINFNTYINYPCDSVVWNFGDGTPLVNGTGAVHSYEDPGTYTVSATLYISSNGAVFCSNLYVRIRVMAGPVITFYDTVCQGDEYLLHGFDIAASESGHFTYTRAVDVPDLYCDSTYVLELEVRDNYTLVEDTICLGNHYVNGIFDITPSETGLYTDTLTMGVGVGGCDSLVILQLTVTPNTDQPPTIEGEAYPCLGGSYTYAIDSLLGLQDVVWTVPDSVFVLSQQSPYAITLLYSSYADSFQLCVSAVGGCGTMNWCRMVYPQPYSFAQIIDTLCVNETEYNRYGFTLTGISDSNDLFINHGISAGGCDSTTVLRLIFMPTYQVYDTLSLCANEFPYLFHDTLIPAAGEYEVSLFSQFGCDSIVNLTVFSNPVYQINFDTTVCDNMVWNGITYNESGDYDTLFVNMYGCDSVVTMHLTVYHSIVVEVDSVVCRSELPISWNGISFGDAGVDSVYLTTSHNCDSLVVMTLIVNEASADTIQVVVLENNLPYTLNGYSYPTEGTYIQQLDNAVGCDSTLTIMLTVLSNVTNSADSVICEHELPFTWNGVTFTQADTLVAILEASTGADSLLVMNVSVIPTTYSHDTLTVCDTYTWINGVNYTETPEIAPTYILTNVGGCDSVITLHLTVNHSSATTLDTAIVENALPCVVNGESYGSTGTYTQTLTNALGCDSALTVHLTVYPNVTVNLDSTVCEDNLPFTWNDSIFTEAGTKTTTILASTGADSTIVMTVTVEIIPFQFDTLTLYQVLLPYYFAPADTTIQPGSSDTVQFTYLAPSATGCDTVVTITMLILETQPLSVALTSTINTQCDGDCHYVGPTILINEVMLLPSNGDGSIVDNIAYRQGEWIELYNPHKCDSVDISGYFLGNNANDYTSASSTGSYEARGGGFVLPQGTIVPPQGFCMVRGIAAPAVPDSLLVQNGGNVVEVVVNARYCYGNNGWRLWFPNAGGWFAFYDANGVPQDAIYWADSTNYCSTCPPCTPTAPDVAFTGTLASFDGIPYSKKNYLGESMVTGQSLRRVPDGGPWSLISQQPTYATCNDVCVDPPVNTGNGMAIATASGGVAPYTYHWDDIFTQTTDTAFNLAAGTYTVTVTDATGNSVVTQVTVTDYEPTVSHNNATACLSDSSILLQGFPAGGVYTGASVTNNTLVFEENVTNYQLIYTYTDENGCSASAPFQVTVTPNTRVIDTSLCSSNLPFIWYNQTITNAGTYTQTVPMNSSCDSLLILHLAVVPQPQLTVDNDVVIEPGTTVTLHASGAATYLWTPAAGLSSTNTATTQASPNQSTMYYVTGFASNDCMAIDSVAVIVIQHIDTTVCDDALPLTWHGLIFEDTVSQTLTIPHPNALDEVFRLHVNIQPVTYSSHQITVSENDIPFMFNGFAFSDDIDTTFIIPNSSGCDSVISLTLFVCRNKVVEMDSTVCENDLPFVWNGLWLTAEGYYQADLQTFCGADSTVHLHLFVIDTALHIVSLTPDFCENQMAELMVVTPMPDYVWSTGETTPTIIVTVSGHYRVTATQGECTNTAHFNIESCHNELYLPNAITPSNGDGLNDYFCIPELNQQEMALFEISIFNRWGEMVFYSTDKNFKWYGEYQGQTQYQTIYNYIIEYTDTAGRPHRVVGSITVL